jgi:hypothetical protein
VDLTRWDAAARTFLLPVLPGDWRLADGTLIRGPVGWTAQLVVPLPSEHPTPTFQVEALVQLMASADPYTHTCARLLGRYFTEPDESAGYEPVMAEIAAHLLAEAVPFFERYGTIDGYRIHLRESLADGAARGLSTPDMNVAEQLVYTELIRGDLAAATEAAGLAEAAGAENNARQRPIGWVDQGLQRVRRVMAADARALLAENAHESAMMLSLPEPDLGWRPS